MVSLGPGSSSTQAFCNAYRIACSSWSLRRSRSCCEGLPVDRIRIRWSDGYGGYPTGAMPDFTKLEALGRVHVAIAEDR